MSRPKQPLTAKQELFIRMSARGEPRADIFREVFGIDLATADERTIHNTDSTMTRWRKLPEFTTIWKEEVDKILMKHAGKAVRTIANLMDSNQPWLQLQAANSLLSYSRNRIYGDEQNAVHVTVEGMPEIGSPDDGREREPEPEDDV